MPAGSVQSLPGTANAASKPVSADTSRATSWQNRLSRPQWLSPNNCRACACVRRRTADGGDRSQWAVTALCFVSGVSRTRAHGRSSALSCLPSSPTVPDANHPEQRVDAAKARIESLNPLVAVETISDPSALEDNAIESLLSGVDMVCVTDVDRTTLVRAPCRTQHPSVAGVSTANRADVYTIPQIRLNDACRRLGKPFYAGGTYGLLGYIFCDLLQHDYIAPYVVFYQADMLAACARRLTHSCPPCRSLPAGTARRKKTQRRT